MHFIHKITFDTPLKDGQIPMFRGSLIKAMGSNAHPLMHNHTEEGLRFGYPLVQYKSVEGRACVVAIDEVGEYILRYFKTNETIPLLMRKNEYKCRVDRAQSESYSPLASEQPYYYSIRNYIPLTGENVAEFDGLMALTDKICFLENILTGNILSFLKGINFFTDERIVSVITAIDRESIIRYKGVRFRTFNLCFVSNFLLPSYIGLGKSTSIGMGTIHQLELPEQYKTFISNVKG